MASLPPFVARWLETVPVARLDEVAPDPATAAIFSTDIINAFLREGALASERIDSITDPVLDLVRRAWDDGIRDFVFLQDTHPPDSPEFEAYPAHAIAGTSESEMIPELAELPFANQFTVIEKNSLHPAIDTGFDAWLDAHPDLRTAIVIGDCTDLCVTTLALHLRLRANARGVQGFQVVVPIDCVDTFDIPDDPNLPPGAAHPAEFFHAVWLYHLASNNIRIVRALS
ncbi:MAG: cysteine hydrolase [Thermomicrobiales bacterium]|nr:cysteine hydrolase [Thermomicrobiales bacterium]